MLRTFRGGEVLFGCDEQIPHPRTDIGALQKGSPRERVVAVLPAAAGGGGARHAPVIVAQHAKRDKNIAWRPPTRLPWQFNCTTRLPSTILGAVFTGVPTRRLEFPRGPKKVNIGPAGGHSPGASASGSACGGSATRSQPGRTTTCLPLATASGGWSASTRRCTTRPCSTCSWSFPLNSCADPPAGPAW